MNEFIGIYSSLCLGFQTMDSTAKASSQAQEFFAQLQSEFASETVKECSESSSGFFDDYLVDPEEANTPCSKQSNDAPVSKQTDSGNSLVSTDHATLENIQPESAFGANSIQAFGANSIQVEEDQTCQTISTSFHGGHAFEQQDQPKAYENYKEDFGVVSDGPVENTILWKKAYFRRSLQFGEAQGDSSGLKRSASESGQVVNLSHSMATSLPRQYYENFCTVSNSGGNRNNIDNPPSIGFSANASKILAYQGVQGINSPSMMNTKSYPVEKDSIRSEQGMDASKALVIASSADNKRRKTESSNGNGNGSSRKCCNCRKSKCLKLYCECFRTRDYCSSSCSCQGCFNKPEYEEKVREATKRAITHNPNAFAPKIAVEGSPNSQEEGNQATPPSGIHRNGCNCKKSMCEKKYCECFQAGVGCSNKCRCEGCKNGYGKKEEFDGMKHGAMRNTVSEITVRTIGNQETLATKRDLPSCSTPPNFTPKTPSFQYSDHIKDVPNSRIHETAYPMSMKMLTSTQTIEDFNIFQHHLTPPDAQVPFHGSNHWRPSIPFALVQPYHGRNQLQSVAPPSGSCWPRNNQLSSGVNKTFDLQDHTSLEKKSPNKKQVSSQIYELSSSSFREELRSSSRYNLKYPPAFPPLNRNQN